MGTVTKEHLEAMGLSDFVDQGGFSYETGSWDKEFSESLAILSYLNLIPQVSPRSVASELEKCQEGIPEEVDEQIRLRDNGEPVLVSTRKLAWMLGFYSERPLNRLIEVYHAYPGVLVSVDKLPFENRGKRWDLEASIYNYSRISRTDGFQKNQTAIKSFIIGHATYRRLFGLVSIAPSAISTFVKLFNAVTLFYKDELEEGGKSIFITQEPRAQTPGHNNEQTKHKVFEIFEKYKPLVTGGIDSFAGKEALTSESNPLSQIPDRQKDDNFIINEDGSKTRLTPQQQVALENKRRIRLVNDVNESKSIDIGHFLATVSPITARIIKRIDSFESFVQQVFPSASGRQMERIRKNLDNAKNDIYRIPETVLGPMYKQKIGYEMPLSIEELDDTEELTMQAGSMGELPEEDKEKPISTSKDVRLSQ